MNTPGSRIKHMREEAGLSQEEFARKIGMSQSALSDAERDVALPRPKFLVTMSELTGRSIDWLLKGGNEEPPERGMQAYNPVTESSDVEIPLFLCPAPAGAVAPADDYVQEMLDVTTLAVPNPVNSFACKVTGDSMIGAQIETGDIVIVDRRMLATSGCIVVGTVDGELTIKRLEQMQGKTYLYPENERYAPIEIRDGMNFHIWGVAVRVIKRIG